MSSTRFPFTVALAFLAGQLAVGCAVVSQRARRIADHPELFNGLPAIVQTRIKNGDIDLGYHKGLVYLALGQPNKTGRTPLTPEGGETWTYDNFVFGPNSAITVALNNPGARYQSRVVSPNAPRSGGTIFQTGPAGPGVTMAENMNGIATLLVDLVDGYVVRIRLDLYSNPSSPSNANVPPTPPAPPTPTRSRPRRPRGLRRRRLPR